jgi:hypothetical protein
VWEVSEGDTKFLYVLISVTKRFGVPGGQNMVNEHQMHGR